MKKITLSIGSKVTGPTNDDGLADYEWTVTLERGDSAAAVASSDLGVAFQKAYLALMHDENEASE